MAILTSVFAIATCIQGLCIGSLEVATGGTVIVICSAGVLAFCGALSATQLEYHDL